MAKKQMVNRIFAGPFGREALVFELWCPKLRYTIEPYFIHWPYILEFHIFSSAVNADSLLEKDTFNVVVSLLLKGSFATVYRCHSKKHEDSYVSLLLIYCIFVMVAGHSDNSCSIFIYIHKFGKCMVNHI